MSNNKPSIHSQLESIVMIVTLMLYMAIRLVANIIAQPVNIIVLYINHQLSKIERSLNNWCQNWDKETADLLCIPGEDPSSAYGLYGLRQLCSIVVKSFKLVLTIVIFIPFQLTTNCVSFLASKLYLPLAITMNRYFMYLFHGQANRVISGKHANYEVSFYTKFQQLDSQYSHDINNLNRQYSNVANPKITKKTNINHGTHYVRRLFTKIISDILSLVQNITYYLLLPITYLANLILITMPYNFFQFVIVLNEIYEYNYCRYLDNYNSLFEKIMNGLFDVYLSIPLFIFGRDAFIGTAFHKKLPYENRSKNYYGVIYQSFSILQYIVISALENVFEIMLSIPKYVIFSLLYLIDYISEIGVIPFPTLVKDIVKCDHRHLHAKHLYSESPAFPKVDVSEEASQSSPSDSTKNNT